MNENNNDIVVLRYFDNAIDANIAKTKLDAYGIPCFLTEENMAGLYPGQGLTAIRVRLHLFASDRDRAEHLLARNSMHVHTEGGLDCPRCQSTRIERGFPKKVADTLTYVLFGVFLPHRKVNVCLTCGYEF